ncbi:hypothetical protein UFOVP916_3 [uncultured Caudovirales phage]|uniref:COMM domain-containing protein n=1 Tax=uncultured Caudovirales phage TaxID=2100421 RepID=A0A6J5SHJ4_9CAUD|nr:hypothetical protein UFOVP827_24 [uncultured Caudovirales phage]CAB4171414.1 hypothetical protein UFOVP916_3 [uncultured Caudovirales phage]CAB4177351.1 hypothetical protein UFOVP1001_27 [uncultured Caudovirales phage]CAB4199483.1 hypothetical protein UFOVP1338_49 [uncultured Caudovirales phage]CAB4213501.1 hypothetical protein UFOVP1447_44 [uncultured Caudovirales phage]
MKPIQDVENTIEVQSITDRVRVEIYPNEATSETKTFNVELTIDQCITLVKELKSAMEQTINNI